uniref:AAA+ ATPase domain-containing protein n=1 Tax=Bionectria ochroleuca TaxID=29856 RepID=A0A0B7K9C2_BIOOC
MDQAEGQTSRHSEAKPSRQGEDLCHRLSETNKVAHAAKKGISKNMHSCDGRNKQNSTIQKTPKKKVAITTDGLSGAKEDSDESSSDEDLNHNEDSSSDSEDGEEDSVKSKSMKSTKSSRPSKKNRDRPKRSRSKAKRSAKKKYLASGSDSSESSDTESDEGSDGGPSDKADEFNLKQELLALKTQIALLTDQQASLHGGFGHPTNTSSNPYMATMPGAPMLLNSLPTRPSLDLSDLTSQTTNRGKKRVDLDTLLGQARMRKLLGANGSDAQRVGTASTEKMKKKTTMRAEFKRVDWVWDTSSYQFRLQDSAEVTTDAQYDEFVFHVRRMFDVEGKYRKTCVDIKSKLLRECLHDVIGNIQGVSLVDETPKLDPNLLFLYLDELRVHLKALKGLEPAGDTKKVRQKNQKRLDDKRKHLKVLIKYLDHDYASLKASLIPMLQNGLITFELLWALWKPGTLAYSPTYGNNDIPRVFRVEASERHNSLTKGEFYFIDGKYFEYDGKRFGLGNVSEDVLEFTGARKITSLPCYPLAYCANEAAIRKELVERGKKFVALSGMHYRGYNGMAYLKRKKGTVRFNIQNSRIMIDPATFRRINPNYYVSHVRPQDHDIISSGASEEDDDEGHGCNDGDSSENGDSQIRHITKVVKDKNGDIHMVRMDKSSLPGKRREQNLEDIPAKSGDSKDNDHQNSAASEPAEKGSISKTEDKSSSEMPSNVDDEESKDQAETPNATFTDEEYLIASPLVLGFSFAEKQWLEFSVADVRDIQWNDQAWESLVLDPETKDLIRALVESRKFNAATKIDDVIQGKGKGLVTVLHGPPGVGKTLTAEGISELLKCPLYMASAGELGTDSRFLEHELQKILDICHTWGAILLLDEADVFLEKRNMQDIHRNALVSIFLRQLEYFQGILFLTTNRVETFDEAFQSRIHIALRYEKLDVKAKKAVFKLFIGRVQEHGRIAMKPLEDHELNTLAKHDLNGREIKNVVGSAQDLAANRGEALSMKHINQVLEVHAKFGRDLKGGTGFEDAMRSYF